MHILFIKYIFMILFKQYKHLKNSTNKKTKPECSRVLFLNQSICSLYVKEAFLSPDSGLRGLRPREVRAFPHLAL